MRRSDLVTQRRRRGDSPRLVHDGVHGVLRHLPVGRELASRHGDDAVRGGHDRVAAREVGRALRDVPAPLGWREQRAQAGPDRGDVGPGQPLRWSRRWPPRGGSRRPRACRRGRRGARCSRYRSYPSRRGRCRARRRRRWSAGPWGQGSPPRCHRASARPARVTWTPLAGRMECGCDALVERARRRPTRPPSH